MTLGVRDITLYDSDRAARRRASEELRVPTHDLYSSALAWEPEAALICTPTEVHLSQAQHLLAQGVHLFIEPPLAVSWEGVSEFVNAAEGSKRIVQVGYNMRFHPAVTRIQHEVIQGNIGTPWVLRTRFGHYLPLRQPNQDYRSTYSAQSAQGGGALMDGIHEVDYMLWWGGKVQETRSLLGQTSDLEIDVEDYATLLLRFESGAVGEVRVDYLRYEMLREAELIGSSGMLLWESSGDSSEHILVRRLDKESQTYHTLYEAPRYDINQTYIDEIKHFIACINGEVTPLLPVSDAAASLSVVLEAKGLSTRAKAV